MRKILFFSITFIFSMYSQAQQQKADDSLRRYATVKENINGNVVSYLPETPPLNQIAGAPKTYYSYFWEFGDGNYSTQKEPKHNYKKPGTYNALLWATNNYDTGKPPVTRPKKVVINTITDDYEDVAVMTTDFSLKRNREPMPNEEMVMVVSYKNNLDYISSGKIHLFYNEKKFNVDNFEISNIRTHHREQPYENNSISYNTARNDNATLLASTSTEFTEYTPEVQDTVKFNLPQTLEEAKQLYKSSNTISFNNLTPGEERNIFLTMRTPPEMIKDTSAIISVRGIYVPDNNYCNHTVKDMEMEVVTSHDPNKMSSNGTFMSYRLVRFKRLKYKIKFQNNGEGPARTIRLETDIPEMFDKSTLKIEDMYPKCPICPDEEVRYSCLDTTFTKEQAIFTFKNIYLPGSEQKNVQEIDSTKGFVKYSIKFAKDFHKKKTKSKTAIIFDKNEPIITNYATTRFSPGISVGVKTGYNYYPKLTDSKSYFVGAIVSPYKSYRWYWQAEFVNAIDSYSTSSFLEREELNQTIQEISTTTEFKNINWEIPVLIRYNINNYIGVGAGVQANFNLSEQSNTNTTINIFEFGTSDMLIGTESFNQKNTESFVNLKTGVLFDVTAGFARIGPSIGARYVLNFEDDFNYWQLYARFKF